MSELAQVSIALVISMIAAATMVVWLVLADRINEEGDRDE